MGAIRRVSPSSLCAAAEVKLMFQGAMEGENVFGEAAGGAGGSMGKGPGDARDACEGRVSCTCAGWS